MKLIRGKYLMNIFSAIIPSGLARYLTLSLSLSLSLSLLEKIGDFVYRRVGMIFLPSLLLYLTENWKAYPTNTILVFIGHIVCAFSVIIKYHSIEKNVNNGYTTGFT
jgi:hypothetical protein